MEKYKVIIQQSAEYDLNSIVEYIAISLKEKEIAIKLYKKIKEGINSLQASPGRCAIVDEKRLKSMGIRRLLVDNYSVFNYVDNSNNTVHILRILYNKRNWKKLITDQ